MIQITISKYLLDVWTRLVPPGTGQGLLRWMNSPLIRGAGDAGGAEGDGGGLRCQSPKEGRDPAGRRCGLHHDRKAHPGPGPPTPLPHPAALLLPDTGETARTRARTHTHTGRQYDCISDSLFPELTVWHVRVCRIVCFLSWSTWTEETWCSRSSVPGSLTSLALVSTPPKSPQPSCFCTVTGSSTGKHPC